MKKFNKTLLDILNENVYHWFKSLDISKRVIISEQYNEDTGINDILTEGLTKNSENWLVQNYTDDLKDYIIMKTYDLG